MNISTESNTYYQSIQEYTAAFRNNKTTMQVLPLCSRAAKTHTFEDKQQVKPLKLKTEIP